MVLGGLLSYFGIMHSVSLDGSMYLPWDAPVSAHGPSPALLACAYSLSGLMFLIFGKLSPEVVAAKASEEYPWQVHEGLDRVRFGASDNRSVARDARPTAVGDE